MRALLGALDAPGYDFVRITLMNHARVAPRRHRLEAGVRDLSGWSRAVDPASVPGAVLDAVRIAGVLCERDGGIASMVRVSRVRGRLFAHSAGPTEDADNVFLGPDSYRFAVFVATNLPGARPRMRVIDIGGGAGVGAMVAAGRPPGAQVTMSGVHAKALDFARANADCAEVEASFVHARGMEGVEGALAPALFNPPCIVHPEAPACRDGGDMLGAKSSLHLASEALERFGAQGTGAAIYRKRDC